MQQSLFGRRYQLLNLLGKGGMGEVYRAHDRLNNQTVALKKVLIPPDQFILQNTLDVNDPRVALANEFQTLASLRHPNIISVLDYGFDYQENGIGQPYFTMDLLKGFSPINEVMDGLTVEIKLNLIVQMLQALDYLHRRKILHHDLKPGNVLCDKETVKLLDFGLAVKDGQASGTAGTMAYMAPEVLSMFQATSASDLYSVGLIMYELLTGKYAYPYKNVADLLRLIISTTPDLTLLYEVDLPDNGRFEKPQYHLVSIIGKLLSKTPGERYQSVTELITEFIKLLPRITSLETPEIRESYLQAAEFVGREDETAKLNNALDETLQGTGSSWLIGGESGVGKSRLVDELRTWALVNGAMVLVGQGVADGGLPYQLWRDPVRRLVLATDLTELEASVLKALVPDICDLLERDVLDAAEINNRETQRRIINTLIDVFRRQQDPIVLILEDLQWAVESLEVLKAIIPLADTLPLLIIGTYRSDEKPDLPNDLPKAKVLSLERLSQQAIEELSHSMLGSVGRMPRIVNLLQRETEGNVFFVVEVVRALAEYAGQLNMVDTAHLPTKIFARGIQDIVESRLKRIAPEAQWALRVAAVNGRHLDLQVMEYIFRVYYADLKMDLQKWLALCANGAVLQVQEERWRFVHDKVREGILNQLGDAERKEFHRIVAEATETIYANQEDYAAVLARHWGIAGNARKEYQYSTVAGQSALRQGLFTETITFLERALDLAKELSEVDKTWYSLIQYQLGRAYVFLGKYAKAHDCIEQSLETAYEINVLGRIIDGLVVKGTLGIWQGSLDDAHAILNQALALARQHGTQSQLVTVLNWLSAVCIMKNDHEQVKAHLDEAWEIGKRLDNEPLMIAQLLNTQGEAARYQYKHSEAAVFYKQALEIYQAVADSYASIAVSLNLGHVLRVDADHDNALTYYRSVVNTSGNLPNILPLCLDAIAGYARIKADTGYFKDAVELAGFVLQHPAVAQETKLLAQSILDDLESHFSPEQFNQIRNHYSSEDLEKVIYIIGNKNS